MDAEEEGWGLSAGGGDPGDHDGSAPSPARDRKTAPPLCEAFNWGFVYVYVCMYIWGRPTHL